MRAILTRASLRALFGTFRRATGGNLTITFAFAAVPVLFALGATADYGFAVKTRARMNAAADAAVLAAVTPQMMTQTNAAAVLVARNMFLSQVSSMPRLTFDPTNVANFWVDDGGGDKLVNNQRVRTITVGYRAQSQTAFSAIIHMATIAIGGASTATASTPPNIDFYLMLDTSPSMAIPATQAGIDAMVKFTPYQDGGTKTKPVGCAFACHETSPQKENMGTSANPVFGNPGCADDPAKGPGPCRDNYWLAKNPPDGSAPILLRIDLVNLAVQNLVDTARTSALQTGAVYQLAGYTFDDVVANPIPLQLPTNATKTQAQNGINMLVVDHENSDNGDQNTVFDSSTDATFGAFPRLRAAMAAAYNNAGAGNGTNAVGDHPQQVLMIVTDGVSDQPYNGSRIYKPLGGSTNLSSRSTQICTTIKSNPNVRIAVLYLVYTPLPMNGGASWYAKMIAPQQNDISPTLNNCASPGLFYQVNVGGDISTALSNLFSAAVKNARLSY